MFAGLTSSLTSLGNFWYPFPSNSNSRSLAWAASPHDESGDSSNGSRGMYFADFWCILPVSSDSSSFFYAASLQDESDDSTKGLFLADVELLFFEVLGDSVRVL